MRYAQGGGLTAERRRLRERIRYEEGERFGRGERTAVIALGPVAEDCRTVGTAAGHPCDRLRLAATVTSTGAQAAGRG